MQPEDQRSVKEVKPHAVGTLAFPQRKHAVGKITCNTQDTAPQNRGTGRSMSPKSRPENPRKRFKAHATEILAFCGGNMPWRKKRIQCLGQYAAKPRHGSRSLRNRYARKPS